MNNDEDGRQLPEIPDPALVDNAIAEVLATHYGFVPLHTRAEAARVARAVVDAEIAGVSLASFLGGSAPTRFREPVRMPWENMVAQVCMSCGALVSDDWWPVHTQYHELINQLGAAAVAGDRDQNRAEQQRVAMESLFRELDRLRRLESAVTDLGAGRIGSDAMIRWLREHVLVVCNDPSVSGGCKRPPGHRDGHSAMPILDDPGAMPVTDLLNRTAPAIECPSLYLTATGHLVACEQPKVDDPDLHSAMLDGQRIAWRTPDEVPAVWPKDQEPPTGINMLRDTIGGEHLRRTASGKHWSWTDDANDPGASWAACVANADGDLVVVRP